MNSPQKILGEDIKSIFSNCGKLITFGTHQLRESREMIHFICARENIKNLEELIKFNIKLLKSGSVLKRGQTPIFLTTDEKLWREILDKQL